MNGCWPRQPLLNAPLLRADAGHGSDGHTAQHIPSSFDWGTLKRGLLSEEDNPLRQASAVEQMTDER